MNQLKFTLTVLIASFFVLSMLSISFATPADTYAHPAYGFTPPPPPPPPPPPGGGGGGGTNDDDGSDDDGGTQPTHTVIVEVDRCNLSCSVGHTDTDYSQTLLASVDGAYLPSQNLVAQPDTVANIEVLIPAQLVHQGSGFIVEKMLSDTRSTFIPVPYPGQWEVLMINAPQFVTGELMDMTGLNVAQLQADLANDAVSLGVVQANAGPQLVKCPIECVIEAPPKEEAIYLPETGQEKTNASLPLIIAILVLGILALPISYVYVQLNS